MDLEKSVRNVLLKVEKNNPEINELIKGFRVCGSTGFSKPENPKVYLKADLKLLRNSRRVCRKNYDPISYSRDYWVGMALAQIVLVLSTFLSDSTITWWDKMRLGSSLRTTATFVGRAIKRISGGKEAVSLIRAELKAIVKSNKLEKGKNMSLLLFEREFAK